MIYLPRRGLLEVWSPERKWRVVEFNVSKCGRLLSSSNCLVDRGTGHTPLRAFDCGFLDHSGKLYQLHVPVHALTNKASSHDATLQKQVLSAMDSQEEMDKIVILLKAVKSSATKLALLLQVFKAGHVTVQDCRRMTSELTEQLAENDMALKYCHLIERAVELYEFLSHAGPANVKCDAKTGLNCSSYESDVIEKLLCDNPECDEGDDDVMEEEELAICHFFECVTVKVEHMTTSDDNDVKIYIKTSAQHGGSLLKLLSASAHSNPEKTAELLKAVGVDGRALMAMVFATCIDGMTLRTLWQSVGAAK